MSGTELVTGGMIAGTPTSTNWTDAEKEQMRSALGIDGTKNSVVDSEIMDNIDSLPSGADIADDVWDKDLTENDTLNTAGKILKQIKSIIGTILGFIS